jgi:hypothetical protein
VHDDDAGLAWEILQRYVDPATARFDAALAASGVPDDVARDLRFWQREAVANVKQYAAEALPAVFTAIAVAQRVASEATRRAGDVRDAVAGAHTPDPWSLPPKPPELVITLPDYPEAPETAHLLEERRRMVAARLADL